LEEIPEHVAFTNRVAAETRKASEFYRDRLGQAKIEFLALSRTVLQLGLIPYTFLSQTEGLTDPGSTINMLLRHYQLPEDTITVGHANQADPSSPDAIAGITFVANDADVVEGSRDRMADTIESWVVGGKNPTGAGNQPLKLVARQQEEEEAATEDDVGSSSDGEGDVDSEDDDELLSMSDRLGMSHPGLSSLNLSAAAGGGEAFLDENQSIKVKVLDMSEWERDSITAAVMHDMVSPPRVIVYFLIRTHLFYFRSSTSMAWTYSSNSANTTPNPCKKSLKSTAKSSEGGLKARPPWPSASTSVLSGTRSTTM